SRVEDSDRVESRLEPHQEIEARAQGSWEKPGPVEADAVMMTDGRPARQGGVGHGVPGLMVVALSPLVIALGPPTGEGEVQAGAVRVGVRLVGRCGQGSVDCGKGRHDLFEEAGKGG